GDHEGVPLAEALMVTVAGPGSNSDTRIAWPGCPASDGEPALRLGDAGLAIDAAANGLGQANVPAMLAEADIAAGRVRQVGDSVAAKRGYWLVAPTPQWRQAKVKALVAALTA
ncbi:MAG TPA: LysR substrate-binding domain-containing protein, partial [Sphingopyxis sp.]|nr:LysR substrate-binding domain-containing protein [Sphingopyxis sp.]